MRTKINPLESEITSKINESTETDKMVKVSATQNNQNIPDQAYCENNTEITAECEEIFNEYKEIVKKG